MAEAVARGSLVLSLDAQQLNKGLDKAKQDSKKAGSEIAKNLKDSSKEKIGELAGGGSILGLGAKAGIAGLAVGTLAFVGKELAGVLMGVTDTKLEMERADRMGKLWLENMAERLTRVKERLSEFQSVMATPEGLTALREEIDQLGKETGGLESAMHRAQKEFDKFKDKWASPEAMQHYMVGELEGVTEATKKQLEIQREAYEKYQKAKRELIRQENELVNNPMSNVAARSALRSFVTEMEDAANVVGKTASEQNLAKLDKLQKMFGFKDADLGAARLAVLKRNAAEATQAISDFVDEQYNVGRDADLVAIEKLKKAYNLTDADVAIAKVAVWNKNAREADKVINEMAESLGLLNNGIIRNADEVKLDELIKAGIDDKQVKRLRELIQLKKDASAQYNPLKPMEAGTWDAIGFQNKMKFENDKKAGINQEKLLKEVVQKLIMINLGIAGINVNSPEI